MSKIEQRKQQNESRDNFHKLLIYGNVIQYFVKKHKTSEKPIAFLFHVFGDLLAAQRTLSSIFVCLLPALETLFAWCFEAAQQQEAVGRNRCEWTFLILDGGGSRQKAALLCWELLALIVWEKKIVLAIMKNLFVNPVTLLQIGSFSTHCVPADRCFALQ